MAKNIEMNIKEQDSTYEALYPKNISNLVLLSDAMNEFYGYENGTLEDVLLQLLLGVGTYGYQIKVVYPDGSPVVGSTVSGITAIRGRDLVTDENGVVLGTSESQSVTIGATSPCIDMKAASGVSVQNSGILTNYTVQLEYETEIVQISNSQTVNLSHMLQSIDVCAVGGGGGGGNGSYNSSNRTQVMTAGGGGGYSNNILDYKTKNNLVITIGSGTTQFGGTTIVQDGEEEVLNALGGNPGESESVGSGSGTLVLQGGVGNGRGGNSYYSDNSHNYESRGESGTVYIFNETNLGLSGGGGGGGATWGKKYGYSYAGQPNGGVGTGYETSVTSGKPFGGGGGGGYVRNFNSYGGQGGVYLRFHH